MRAFAVICLRFWQLLVRFGADIHRPLNDGRAPVFIAAQAGAADALRVLIDANADVHASAGAFGSAADVAAEFHHVACLQLIDAAAAAVETNSAE